MDPLCVGATAAALVDAARALPVHIPYTLVYGDVCMTAHNAGKECWALRARVQ